MKRGRRDALVDFQASCKAGCPFYEGKDVTGVFCNFDRASEASKPRVSYGVSAPL